MNKGDEKFAHFQINRLLSRAVLYYSKKNFIQYTAIERRSLKRILDTFYTVYLENGLQPFYITTAELNQKVNLNDHAMMSHINRMCPVFVVLKTLRQDKGYKSPRAISLTETGIMLMEELHRRRTENAEQPAAENENRDTPSE